MKKIFFLLISIAVLTSCSDDDDSITDDGTKIIGKWFLIDIRIAGSQNNLSECNQNSYIQFNADNTSKSEFYDDSEGESEVECKLEDSNEGEWKYLGNNRYQIYVPNFGNQTGNVNFVNDTRFIFTSSEIPGGEVVFEK
ncbi:lipocalin family protein [Christiangramia salexigens]|uniref:Type IV secretion system putative lipoprotein virB7 n=1 Tax=Christiangramia salexigens TaxID=1913577 RepID=A0A1L3J479_9FLAO|nr:lipocalin family protein [Christiangramia salexigens]APG59937.1 hypothetical protein LPB144_05715 [Christiangramia salexigens]